MGNKGLDVVQVKLVMDKTLYSEEQLSSPDQVVQFMRKELSEYDREVFCILNCTTKSQVINMNIVSMGTINASLVTGRERSNCISDMNQRLRQIGWKKI